MAPKPAKRSSEASGSGGTGCTTLSKADGGWHWHAVGRNLSLSRDLDVIKTQLTLRLLALASNVIDSNSDGAQTCDLYNQTGLFKEGCLGQLAV
jgi:hypothetical protein